MLRASPFSLDLVKNTKLKKKLQIPIPSPVCGSRRKKNPENILQAEINQLRTKRLNSEPVRYNYSIQNDKQYFKGERKEKWHKTHFDFQLCVELSSQASILVLELFLEILTKKTEFYEKELCPATEPRVYIAFKINRKNFKTSSLYASSPEDLGNHGSPQFLSFVAHNKFHVISCKSCTAINLLKLTKCCNVGKITE